MRFFKPNIKKLLKNRDLGGLIQALGDPEFEIQNAALRALGEIGPPAVEALIAALKDTAGDHGAPFSFALERVGDKRSVGVFIAALEDEDKRVRETAIETLGRIGDERALTPLIATLEDEDIDVRRSAVRALGELGDKRAIEPLKVFLNDEDQSMRDATTFILKKIGWKPPLVTDISRPLEVLCQLCDAYAENDKTRITRLEPLATRIGKDLDRRGGLKEMRKMFEQLGGRRGSRTLEMHWNGIGDWRS
jgi:HEAT repeat protein